MKSIFTSLLIMLFTNFGYSCSCRTTPFSVNHIVESDLVFIGKATKQIEDAYMLIITFKIQNLIKGNIKEDFVQIRSPKHEPACGINVKLNKNIILFAHQNTKGELITSACLRNTYLESASDTFLDIIKDFQTNYELKYWRDIQGDTIAFGLVRNKMPEGYWQIFEENQLHKDGVFIAGQKCGTWNMFRKIRPIPNSFVKHIKQEDPNCKSKTYLVEYNKGRPINTLY